MTRLLQKLRNLFRCHKLFPDNRMALLGLHMNDARRGTGK